VAANNNNAFTGDSVAQTKVTRIFGCEGKTYYRDFDGDGYGSVMFPTTMDCATPIGFAPNSGDCDENDASTNPGAAETCNNADDNCDGRIDEFAAPSCGVGLCRRYADYCAETAPCRPGDPMDEECDGLDDDCDGLVDEGKLCAGDLVCQGAACKTLEAALLADPSWVPTEDGSPVTPHGGAGGSSGAAGSGGISGSSSSAGAGGTGVGGSGAGGGSDSEGKASGCSMSAERGVKLPFFGVLSLLGFVLLRRRR
jgi:MYXO-CTERM domain-containing protein